jgi:hypothetical protein
LHGAALTTLAGTYLSEAGCHDGVWMDDDDYGEGWDPETIYRPCPNNPARCEFCLGKGERMISWRGAEPEECVKCHGTGWADGKPQWPVSMNELV